MPLTTLNKIVVIFMNGGISLLWCLLLWWQSIMTFLDAHKSISKLTNNVMFVFMFLSGCALLGAIIEGTSDFTIRKLIRKSIKSHKWAKSFFQGEMQKEISYWEDHFLKTIEEKKLCKDMLTNSKINVNQLASGIFQKNTTKEHFEWALSHYAMYYLATGYILILTLFLVLPIKYNLQDQLSIDLTILFVVLILSSIYVLCSLAIDKYFYTYLVTFRFACLWAEEQEQKESVSIVS